MIHFIVGIEIKECIWLDGDFSGLYTVSDKNDFDDFPLKDGLVKKILTKAEYEELQDSYDNSKLCYCKGKNDNGIIELDSVAKDKIKELRPKPHKQTYAHPRKKLIEIEFEDKSKIIVEDSYMATDYFNEKKKQL